MAEAYRMPAIHHSGKENTMTTTTTPGSLVIHILPLVALMGFLVPALASQRRRRGVSVAAVIALAFGLFSAVFSITHPHAVMGIHDINDVLPIAVLDAGALLWLVPGPAAPRPADDGRRPA